MLPSSNITITVPYPPSANRLWRYYNGRPIKSREYCYWLDGSERIVQSQWNAETITSPISVDLQIGVPDRRKRDLDNRIKPCLDLLEACGVIENDNLVHALSARWNPDLKSDIIIIINYLP